MFSVSIIKVVIFDEIIGIALFCKPYVKGECKNVYSFSSITFFLEINEERFGMINKSEKSYLVSSIIRILVT